MLSQVFLFTQHLTVDHPYGGNHIDRRNPIREHQELAQQHKRKRHINGITAKAKTPVVMSLSGCSRSIPTRKLFPKETRLRNSSTNPARHTSTPAHETTAESKNFCLLTAGKLNALANT